MIESKFLKEIEDMRRRKQAANSVLTALQTKFGAVPPDLPNRLHEIEDLDFLHQLLSKAILSVNLDEFRIQIPNGALPKP